MAVPLLRRPAPAGLVLTMWLLTVVLPLPGVLLAAPPARALPEADLDYPLRHSFSMVPGIPGHGRNEPTSCFDVPGTENYVCRVVSGHEESGDDRNFTVPEDRALERGDHHRFGRTLITADGTIYEGCSGATGVDPEHLVYLCDYQVRNQVSRVHYEDRRFVLRVLWRWAKYTGDQAGCALATSALWTKVGRATFLAFINDCKNGPLEEPHR